MNALLAVAAGGALGAVARYLGAGWVQDLTGGFFPWGTFVVNAAGCLLLGFSLVWLQATLVSTAMRDLVTIGFLGSFTTFSTFSYETVAMLRDGEWWRAGGYALGSVALGLVAVVAGGMLAGFITHGGRAP
jgi:CrcB protein